MDALTVDLIGLRYKVQAARIVKRIERESGMDRLTEKLTQAGGVVARVTAAIEAKADAVIAREAVLNQKTTAAFAPHITMLDEAQAGLDALERQLALVSNDPLPSSGGSPVAQAEPITVEQPVPVVMPVVASQNTIMNHTTMTRAVPSRRDL